MRSLFAALHVRFPRDVWLTVLATLVGALLGLGITHAYYLKAIDDLKADVEERKRAQELMLRGIESIGTITYHRDVGGKVTGVKIELQGAASAAASATGSLSTGDTPQVK